MHSEKRGGSRRRLRFRSGKLADRAGTFLSDCQIYDRSAEGARLRVATSTPVPDQILLFEDEQNSLAAASIAWRRPNELGIRFTVDAVTPRAREITRKLAGKYYAL